MTPTLTSVIIIQGVTYLKYTVFYDGKCVLCRETKRIFERLDWFKQTKWTSIQEVEKACDYPFLDKKEIKEQMHVVSPSGTIYKGFFAVRKLALLFPLTSVLGLVAYIPFLHYFGVPIYKYIATNRHKFLKAKCEDGSCSIK